MKLAVFSNWRLFTILIASIFLFVFFFYLYNPLWNNIRGLIGGADIFTQFPGTKFKRNLIFAIIPGITPVVSVFISKVVKVERFIIIPIILILIEFLTAFMRLVVINKFTAKVLNNITISVETLKFEEFMFIGALCGCLLIVFLFGNRS
jgi:hypothetical protein